MLGAVVEVAGGVVAVFQQLFMNSEFAVGYWVMGSVGVALLIGVVGMVVSAFRGR